MAERRVSSGTRSERTVFPSLSLASISMPDLATRKVTMSKAPALLAWCKNERPRASLALIPEV